MFEYPFGTTSLNDTFVATSGPALVTVKVKVTTSPTFGVASLIDLTILKSAC